MNGVYAWRAALFASLGGTLNGYYIRLVICFSHSSQI